MSSNNDIPGDFKLLLPWLNVARRMREASVGVGPAVVTMSVFVNDTGDPVTWVMAKIAKVEPKGSAMERLNAIIEAME